MNFEILLQTIETAHVAEISDLKIKVAKIADAIEREQQARCEMQRHYRQQLIDQQADVDNFRTIKVALGFFSYLLLFV